MRLLIVKLSSFGDVVHTLPALTDIRAARPDIEIDWLVESDFAAVAESHPAVSTVHGLEFRKLRWPPGRWPELLGSFRDLRRRLYARRYDLVIDFQGLLKSALIARLAGAPISGYAKPRERSAARFYARTYDVDWSLHAVERNRRLAALALGYSVPSLVGEFGIGTVEEQVPADLGLPERFGVFLHGASWDSKLWPEDRWRDLAEFAAAEGETVVLPWGSAAERSRAIRIAAGLRGAMVLPRRLTSAELRSFLGRAAWVVGLDTGLTHYAAALGARAIWLYGPTDPGRTGPYGDGQLVLASTDQHAPCRRRVCEGHSCMGGVAFERVREALAPRLTVD